MKGFKLLLIVCSFQAEAKSPPRVAHGWAGDVSCTLTIESARHSPCGVHRPNVSSRNPPSCSIYRIAVVEATNVVGGVLSATRDLPAHHIDRSAG